MKKRLQKTIGLITELDFWKTWWLLPSFLFSIAALVLTFFEFTQYKRTIFFAISVFSLLTLLVKIIKESGQKKIPLNIDGSEVVIESGDLFSYPRNMYKVIAFNEYFDTQVDNKIISENTLNGKYIKKYYPEEEQLQELDNRMIEDPRIQGKIINSNVSRRYGGKTVKYELGSIFKDKDYFLVAFSKFDQDNKANLKLNEYANCLIHFWNEVNTLYGQQTVVVPLLGSGITRHKDFNAKPHDLLEVMLWTFKISKVKFREPSKIIIVMLENNLKEVNYYRLKEFEKSGL
ncbi:macro domain-containing protein [Cytobacillus pseudoceanisediminis]|uniref:macro domain-containing protein n=1 Tax=Cytobacillus pseudoceanisediminis TaxID=3051614 RepID=UPI00365C8F9B